MYQMIRLNFLRKSRLLNVHIFKVATNETSTMHLTIRSCIALELYNNTQWQETRYRCHIVFDILSGLLTACIFTLDYSITSMHV